MPMTEVTIHTDGASRGNPGPAAFAYVIQAAGRPAVEHAETIGSATNNVAEYTAMIRALEKAHELGARVVHLKSDSELMVKQMNGEYRVKHPDILPLYEDARALVNSFQKVGFAHVRRGDNARADELCNIVLDGSKSKQPKAAGDADTAAIDLLTDACVAWSKGQGPLPEELWQQLKGLMPRPKGRAK